MMKSAVFAAISALMLSLPCAAQLTESEQRTLDRFEKQWEAYQPTAMRALRKRIVSFKKEIQAIKRDRKLSQSERERRSDEIEEAIEADEKMLKAIKDEETMALPEFDYRRIEPGDFGVVDYAANNLSGYKLSPVEGYFWQARDAKGKVCAFTLHDQDGQAIDWPDDEDGALHVFEVTKVGGSRDRPVYTFRVVNIAALYEKAEDRN